MKPAAEIQRSAWWPALLAAVAGAAVFQFFGNASFGYIKSASLFWWWGFQWFNAESETEHGLIILGLSGWLVWRNFRKHGPYGTYRTNDPIWPALLAMVGGLALHAVGFAAQQARVSVVALLLFTWGVLRLGGGRRWGAAALFPLGFLLLAIPINALDSLSFWLRLWVIKSSTGLAHLAGVGVLQNGTQLLAPDGRYSYDVAPACSGVRSFVALFALSLLIGYLNFRGWWHRGVLVVLCFPLIYLGNVARISSIILAAHHGGQEWGTRAHDIMGVGVFVIVLVGLMVATEVMHRRWPERSAGVPPAVGPDAGGTPALLWKTWIVALVVGILAVAELLFLARLASLPPRGQVGVRLGADGQNPVELPGFLGTEWIGRRTEVTASEREILPPDTGYSRKFYEAVADRSKGVFLSIVLSGRDRSSIHRPELCVVGQGWTIKAVTEHRFAVAGGPPDGIPVTVLHVQRETRTLAGPVALPQLIVYCFVGGDTIESTYWRRLARDAWNRVAHARADRWAYVLMQTDARDGDAAALARMQTVLDQTWPVFAGGGVAGESGK